jgi:hypothetical protein
MKLRLPIDAYEIRAQLLPSMVVSFPVVAFVYGLLPSVRTFWAGIAGSVLEVAALYVLMRLSRDRGAQLQARLYERWGGKPTTAILRHRDATIDPHTKSRYKAVLARLSGLKFPTEESEGASPETADHIYESAIRALLERRRGKSFPLVFRENCNYGFVRNLVGMKPLGLAVVLATLIADAISYWMHLADHKGIAASVFVSFLSGLILLSLDSASVRRTGEAYAIALLRSCEPKGKT